VAVVAALREMTETKGLLRALYSDGGSQVFVIVKAGNR
jgi:hypothetical protein